MNSTWTAHPAGPSISDRFCRDSLRRKELFRRLK
jgi:hypothetical protein